MVQFDEHTLQKARREFANARCVRSAGGILTAEAVPSATYALLAPFRARAEALALEVSSSSDDATHQTPYLFEFTLSRSVNAVAFELEHGHGIAIHYGLWIVMLRAFSAMFTSPGFFPEIGDPSRDEMRTAETVEALRIVATAMTGGASAPESNITMSSCPVRRAATCVLAEMALDFTFFHEFTHIHGGHLDFLGKSLPGQGMAELEALSPSDVLRARRALELDADMWASSLFTVLRHPDWKTPARRYLFGTPEAYLRAWVTAVDVVFRLFEFAIDPAAVRMAQSHPHPSVRRRFALIGLTARADLDNTIGGERAEAAVREAQRSVDTLWASAQFARRAAQHDVDEFSEMADAHAEIFPRLVVR